MSHETVSPAACAAAIASAHTAAVPALTAAEIPDQWNHEAPRKIPSQSIIPGCRVSKAELGRVVYDVRRAHRGGLLHVVNPEPLAAAQDGVRPYAVAAQVVDAGVGHPVVRQAGDEFALQAVVGQRYGDVGVASAVAGGGNRFVWLKRR